MPLVGSLNLCLKKHDSIQKESAQSDHLAKRKCPKCAEIFGYFDDGPKYQIWTTAIFGRTKGVFSKVVLGF